MMDFRSGSPSDNSGAEEMEVSLAKPKHRVVRPSPCLCQWEALLPPWVPPCVRSEVGMLARGPGGAAQCWAGPRGLILL